MPGVAGSGKGVCGGEKERGRVWLLKLNSRGGDREAMKGWKERESEKETEKQG